MLRASFSRDLKHREIVLAAVTAGIVLLALLPADIPERLPSLCLFKRLSGHDCPGCGMTRAIILMLHGRIREGLSRNPRAVAVVPLLAWAYITLAVKCLTGRSRFAACPSDNQTD